MNSKNKWYGLYCADISSKKYVNKIRETFNELLTQANKNINIGSNLATNYNLIAHIKALNTD